MRIKKIHLYVFTEVLGPFLGGILFFSFVFLMFQALRLAEFFIIHGASGGVLLKLTGLMILSFQPIALPIAFLIGVLVGFGRLSSDSELVAMKANGIGINQLAVPVSVLAIMVGVVSLALNMEWVPWGDRTFKTLLIKVSNTKVITSLREGTFTSGFFDLLIYADRLEPKTNRLHKVFIYDEREQGNPMTVVAREGEIVQVKLPSDLGAAAMLKLFNGNIHRNNIQEDTYQKIDFGQYRLYLKVEEGNDSYTLKPRMLTYSELKQRISTTPPESGVLKELKTEYWRRYALALTPLIFVFLGIGFGTIRIRSARVGAALIALVVILIYWSVQAGATVLAQKGTVPPVLAMQLPNLVIGLIAWRGFKSASW